MLPFLKICSLVPSPRSTYLGSGAGYANGQNLDRLPESRDRYDLGEVTLNCEKMALRIEQMIHETFRYNKSSKFEAGIQYLIVYLFSANSLCFSD